LLQHAQRISGNVSQTSRFCGISCAQFRSRKKRFERSSAASEPKQKIANLAFRKSANADRDPGLAVPRNQALADGVELFIGPTQEANVPSRARYL